MVLGIIEGNREVVIGNPRKIPIFFLSPEDVVEPLPSQIETILNSGSNLIGFLINKVEIRYRSKFNRLNGLR